MADIASLCEQMDVYGASDLFISVGKAPTLRISGTVEEAHGEMVETADVERFFDEHLPPGMWERLERERDLDLGVSLSKTQRFRMNLYFQRGRLSMAIRRVPSGALDFEELLIPDIVRELAETPRGLVLITGSTGSGKSTTMAAMVHHINANFQKHIITIEDPIEFSHADLKSLVSQREVGNDTADFNSALKHVVRQNPDVIILGEIRDFETIQTAISAAMTGHLVISTMHTIDVAQTLERIINYFPVGIRDQIAQDFALALSGIVAQRLLPRSEGKGRAPVFEILKVTELARKLIADREFDDITQVLKEGATEGMTTFMRSLVERCQSGVIDQETAVRGASNRDEFVLAMQGIETGIDTLRSYTNEEGRGISMKKLLRDTIIHGASDLLLTVGSPPVVRLHGLLCGFDMPELTNADTQKLVFSLLTPGQRASFERERELDFALSINDRKGELSKHPNSRFRVNCFYQKGCVGSAFRMVPQTIPSAEELRLPPIVVRMAKKQQGLILVTGPTGHGKTTTLGCILNKINEERAVHIITVEDPIEFVHTSKRAIIEQREVHSDTHSFNDALKYVLRQDPDIILIGEMRDTETISAALTAAETGHLVFATLHTNDAMQTVDRIIDVFPSDRQQQVRTQLSAAIEAVISQRLLPRADGNGRIACFEIMTGTHAVRSLIRDERTHQLAGVIETASKDGMITMDWALKDLFDAGLIDRNTYLLNARNPNKDF
ncbi:MAG: PilT/PilU family type 4a pilus ATPase [Lentisphaeria bacterium]|nr:PilT/PilU family type 4a pilus ATPase [Lentisphaeria bacterium]